MAKTDKKESKKPTEVIRLGSISNILTAINKST